MANTFRVGILGNEDESVRLENLWQYGVLVVDLTTEQICNFLENIDNYRSCHTDGFPAPVMTYSVNGLGGGRSYPEIYREELARAVEQIEILIIRIHRLYSTPRSFSFEMAREFFDNVFTENLSDKCKMVIARIVGPTHIGTGLNSFQPQKNKDFLKAHGLDRAMSKYQGKFFVITDKSKEDSKGKKRNKGNKVSIKRVRAELESKALRVAITQPVKETVIAGKTFANFGVRIGRWFSSLMKTF